MLPRESVANNQSSASDDKKGEKDALVAATNFSYGTARRHAIGVEDPKHPVPFAIASYELCPLAVPSTGIGCECRQRGFLEGTREKRTPPLCMIAALNKGFPL